MNRLLCGPVAAAVRRLRQGAGRPGRPGATGARVERYLKLNTFPAPRAMTPATTARPCSR
jgi:hypothetical protein